LARGPAARRANSSTWPIRRNDGAAGRPRPIGMRVGMYPFGHDGGVGMKGGGERGRWDGTKRLQWVESQSFVGDLDSFGKGEKRRSGGELRVGGVGRGVGERGEQTPWGGRFRGAGSCGRRQRHRRRKEEGARNHAGG